MRPGTAAVYVAQVRNPARACDAEEHIGVNALCSSLTKTAVFDGVVASAGAQTIAQQAAVTPLRRPARAEEVAEPKQVPARSTPATVNSPAPRGWCGNRSQPTGKRRGCSRLGHRPSVQDALR